MRFGLASLCAVLVLAQAPARAQQDAALERIGAIAAQIQTTYCPADAMRALDGAVAAMNRAGGGGVAPSISMPTRDYAGFSHAFAAALAVSEDDAVIERAAIEGMVRAFDAGNSFFTLADAQQVRDHSPAAPIGWRMVDGVAVITIPTFAETSADTVREAIMEIRGATPQPSAYIVDLRDNQGGLLDQIIAIADHLIDGGPIAAVQPFGDCAGVETEHHNARRGDLTEGARLLVLTNATTASGAELLAAVLRERRGAVIVGQTTNGQASVHSVIPINGGRDGLVKLRVGTLSMPSGATWDQTGLNPDVAVPAETDSLAHAIATIGP